jgi:large subunit ribosomal protein L24
MRSIRRDDEVVVISGKDKRQRGKVLSVQFEKGRVIVEGLNTVKRHTKPTQAAPQGGIVTKAAPLDVSNVMLYCPDCDGPVRSAIRWVGDSGSYHDTPQGAVAALKDDSKPRKVRVCKKCGQGFD